MSDVVMPEGGELNEEKAKTLMALDRMDANDWTGVRDQLVGVLPTNGHYFIPALLLLLTLDDACPSLFKDCGISFGDILEIIS